MYTPREVQQWREARRKNYPTKFLVEKVKVALPLPPALICWNSLLWWKFWMLNYLFAESKEKCFNQHPWWGSKNASSGTLYFGL